MQTAAHPPSALVARKAASERGWGFRTQSNEVPGRSGCGAPSGPGVSARRERRTWGHASSKSPPSRQTFVVLPLRLPDRSAACAVVTRLRVEVLRGFPPRTAAFRWRRRCATEGERLTEWSARGAYRREVGVNRRPRLPHLPIQNERGEQLTGDWGRSQRFAVAAAAARRQLVGACKGGWVVSAPSRVCLPRKEARVQGRGRGQLSSRQLLDRA